MFHNKIQKQLSIYIFRRSLYPPDDALIVRNISREKLYLQCFTFHHHPRISSIIHYHLLLRPQYLDVFLFFEYLKGILYVTTALYVPCGSFGGNQYLGITL